MHGRIRYDRVYNDVYSVMLVALLSASCVTVIDFAAYSGYDVFIFAYQLICYVCISTYIL